MWQLKLFRNGHDDNASLTLAEMKNQAAGKEDQDDQGVTPEGGVKAALDGVSVQAITPSVQRQLQLPAGAKGVVVTEVEASSRAADAGLAAR